jgi:ribosomal protein L11 methyltransferase
VGRFDKVQLTREMKAHIRKAVQDRILKARRQRTMRDLVNEIAQQQNCSKSDVQSAVRQLVAEGFLEYQYTFGQSYLTVSFSHPVALTPRFTVIPPGHAFQMPSAKIPIVIAPGIAFGDGRHPTTCLALCALEKGWGHFQQRDSGVALRALDIGTGSGILAIAAAELGATGVWALDIDACARSEARHNVRLNPRAASIVHVTDEAPESFEEPFDLIMANLRLPTLARLAEWVGRRLNPKGCVVVSGCREEEWGHLAEIYGAKGLRPLWQDTRAGWAGGVFLNGEEHTLAQGAANGR